MSVDILGTNCDQCVCMVQCCFTSTETIRLIRTGSPGRPPRLSQSSWTLLRPQRRGCLLRTWEGGGGGGGEMKARPRAPTRKTKDTVDRRPNNKNVKAVSSRHCAAASALWLVECCFTSTKTVGLLGTATSTFTLSSELVYYAKDPFHLNLRACAMDWCTRFSGSRGQTCQLGCWRSA